MASDSGLLVSLVSSVMAIAMVVGAKLLIGFLGRNLGSKSDKGQTDDEVMLRRVGLGKNFIVLALVFGVLAFFSYLAFR